MVQSNPLQDSAIKGFAFRGEPFLCTWVLKERLLANWQTCDQRKNDGGKTNTKLCCGGTVFGRGSKVYQEKSVRRYKKILSIYTELCRWQVLRGAFGENCACGRDQRKGVCVRLFAEHM